jgi:16S rRNA A1518/A1519 N6-dimethyltransferase RsmA/KsgA/DIM1 with predicted DNA glycosylase/AP lyase activity
MENVDSFVRTLGLQGIETLAMAIVEDPEQHEMAALAAAGVSFAGQRVLEIGCGDGRLTGLYERDAASIVAIDPDVHAIARLATRFPRVDARATAFVEVTLPPQSIDVVLFAWSL